MSYSEVLANLRDLKVQLQRGNNSQAESIIAAVSSYLKTVIVSADDSHASEVRRAQQTIFAVDEARIMLSQHDLDAAATAARDATNEWRQPL
jgi:hypothetical protein